jgi:hypothetical protein
MKNKFKKYWTDVHGLMELDIILDPRYKLQFMKAFHSTMYGEDSAVTEAEVEELEVYCMILWLNIKVLWKI